MTAATSAYPVAADSHSGHQAANTKEPLILVLKQGENLFESLLRFAREARLQSAALNGLGGLSDITVAYYNLDTKQYQTRLFTGMYELISLNGNISFFENNPFLHIHAALGSKDYSVYGGHIMDATVNPSAEITLIPLPGRIERAYDEVTGLKIMCPIK
ncbi:hypothetical protein AQUSIP_00590 [Aquicella siphonis]|uniref:PPC domain-containing protein n=1 Tax=Aquicella siphonis TaxID=254247 RepID=A0A5E4PED6_9COXI|nr:PPC domain-containing DNA-binding protein [Aquicella siphonis]VVC74787.1 hypothetical protein AQUSIP_00590 [Aquicella siphonis]